MYINAVSGYFAPSSRSNEKTNWDKMSLKEFKINYRKCNKHKANKKGRYGYGIF
jgi:hypothetical protein